MFYSIEAVTERGARGHYCCAAKLFRLCTYLNVEVDRESLGSTEHLWWQIHNFSSEKTYVNRRFKTSCFADVSASAGYFVPYGPWNDWFALCLLCCAVHAVPDNRKEKRNAGNDNDRMIATSSIILHFKPI